MQQQNLNQVYNQQNDQQPAILEYDNTRPLLEVEEDFRKVEFTPKKTEEAPVVKYNIKSAGVLNNNDNRVQTTTGKTRSRTRGRSRFATTTPGPVTTTFRQVISRVSASSKPPEEEEFYGFTRQPAFAPVKLNVQANKAQEEPAAAPVRFVGEIRPKYTPRPTTAKPTAEEDEVPVSTRAPRIRTRTRSRTKAADEEQVTRRATTAGRTRGRTHYRAPENLKRESDDEDVAGQNYPANFLQKLDADQTPSPSYYSATWALPNSLDHGGKKTQTPVALAVEQTTRTMSDLDNTNIEGNEEVGQKPGRRKGGWKLIRTRPADPLDVQESQNYQSVLNDFGSIEKAEPESKLHLQEASTEVKTNKPTTTTTQQAKTQENLFDTIYEMFGVFTKSNTQPSATTETQNATTTTPTPTVFPEEITESDPQTTTIISKTPEDIKTETTTELITETTSTAKSVKTSTSTSTEVSQETEICYKGRCVKSRDKKRRLQ